MVEADIRRKVRELVRKALDGGWDKERLIRQLKRVLNDPFLKEDFKREILDEAARQFDYVKKATGLPMEERMEFVRIIETAGSDFATVQKKISRDIVNAVVKGLSRDESKEEIRKRVERVTGRFRNAAEAITQTALGGFDSANTFAKAKDAGLEKFRYYGPPAERNFCKEHLNKVYSLSEIEQMSNGQGLSVKLYRGGYRCRHRWVVIE